MSEVMAITVATDTEREELKRLRTVLRALGGVVYEWDIGSGAVVWSGDVHETLGVASTIDLSTRAGFVAQIVGDDMPLVSRAHGAHMQSRAPFEIEYRLKRADGHARWLRDQGVVEFTDDGRPARIVGSLQFAGARHHNSARLEWLTSYDELTGHYNRVRLREALSHALSYACRYDAPGAYLVVSIDDLPTVGDAYGHEIADAAVIAVGQELDMHLRASDVIGRVSPDQFGVIVSNCPEDDVQVAADKLLAGVQRAVVQSVAVPIQLTASVGGVTFPGTVRTALDAMAKADVALEEARKAGHNCFVTYNLTEAQRGARRRDLAIAKRIQTALQSDRLRFAFQPVVESRTGKVAFYECLMRMRGEDGDYAAAGTFLRVAEEMGLVRLIDRRALELAVGELEQNPDVQLAINLSGLTTTDPSWLRTMIALVKGRPEIARRLVVEITETAALRDLDETVRFVNAVREIGCRVALDDFGAGYTGFRHLKALAIDIVKIDGSFVANLVEQPEDLLFVKTLQNLAEGFGLQVVAECVESAAVAELLTREGITFLQGYHTGRPAFDRPWLDRAAPATHLAAAS